MVRLEMTKGDFVDLWDCCVDVSNTGGTRLLRETAAFYASRMAYFLGTYRSMSRKVVLSLSMSEDTVYKLIDIVDFSFRREISRRRAELYLYFRGCLESLVCKRYEDGSLIESNGESRAE